MSSSLAIWASVFALVGNVVVLPVAPPGPAAAAAPLPAVVVVAALAFPPFIMKAAPNRPMATITAGSRFPLFFLVFSPLPDDASSVLLAISVHRLQVDVLVQHDDFDPTVQRPVGGARVGDQRAGIGISRCAQPGRVEL